MNAVILLVWLAGADVVAQAEKPAPPPPARPVPAVAVGHGSACDPCCDRGGHKILDRLRGLFHRCDDGCKNDCRHFHERRQQDCCDGPGHKLLGLFDRLRHRDCDDGCGHKLRARLHGIFRKHDDCCDSHAPAHIHPHAAPRKPAGEKIGLPKEPKKAPVEKKAGLGARPPASLTIEAPGLIPNR